MLGKRVAIDRASRQSCVVVEIVMQPVTPWDAASSSTALTPPGVRSLWKSGNVRWQCVSITWEDIFRREYDPSRRWGMRAGTEIA